MSGLLGFAGFLGSIFCHLTSSVAGGEAGSVAFALAREQISLATWAVTLPGLSVWAASMLGLCLVGFLPWRSDRGVQGALLLVVLIVMNAWLQIVPVGEELLSLTRQQAEVSLLAALKRREDVAGGVNLLLTLAVVLLLLRSGMSERRPLM
ncbi:MAG: hypothetical protein Q4D91_13515 [Lautropia sp.]|nr:hypothetical protein [Lautropia sp.]